MPRNSTGTYTLVAGNPVITGTVIESDWANTTMPDLGVEMSDSLSRSGKGGMLSTFKAVTGSAAAPSMTFNNFTGQGLYSSAEGDVRMSVEQIDQMRWTNNVAQVWDVADTTWYDVVTEKTLVTVSIETKTLADGQTVVVFDDPINGAAYAINGDNADTGRLLQGPDYNVVVGTKTVTLTNSYPAGTTLTATTGDAADVNPITVEGAVANFSELASAVASTELISGMALNLAEHTVGQFGGAMWDVVDASSVTPNGIDIVGSVGVPSVSFVLRISGPVLITQAGGLGDGVFDNSPIHTKLQTRAAIVILPSNTGTENYFYASPPTRGSHLVTITERSSNFSGVTREELNAWSQGGMGVPTARDIADATGPVVDRKMGIVAGTIRQQQKQDGTAVAAGTTATVTQTAHGYTNADRIIREGATQTDYNGTFSISNVTANTYDYVMPGSPTSPATGSPTGRKPSQWDFINDSVHVPVGVDTSAPIIASGTSLNIPYSTNYSQVVSFVVGPDESLANAHNLTVGASVGTSFSTIKAGATLVGTAIIRWDGANWLSIAGTGQDLHFKATESGGILTITHDYCPGIAATVSPYSVNGAIVPYQPYFDVTVGNSQLKVAFRQPGSAVKYTGAPSTAQSILLIKTYSEGILLDGSGDSDTLDLSIGNLWFYGVFIE